MRLMIVAFVVAIALIVDQLRFSGYYRHTTVDAIDRSARLVIAYVR